MKRGPSLIVYDADTGRFLTIAVSRYRYLPVCKATLCHH
jgi:hypothetical protein